MKQRGVAPIFIVLILAALAGYFIYQKQTVANPTRITTTSSPTIQPTPTSRPNPTTVSEGTISGKLCYPSSFLPKGKIVAKSITTGKIYSQDYPGSGAGGKSLYNFHLPQDKYNLRYYVSDNLIGYHTTVCPTGNENTCGDRGRRILISADLTANKIVSNFDLCDFYYRPEDAIQF